MSFSTLLPPSLQRQIPPLYAQEENADPTVYVKFFLPGSYWTWYVTEFDPKEDLCFGYVVGDAPEWGYFSLQELHEIRLSLTVMKVDVSTRRRSQFQMAVSVMRDQDFTPRPFSQVQAQLHRSEED